MSGTITVRHERCVACKRCRLACIVEHSDSRTLHGAIAQKHAPTARIQIAPRGRKVLPAACRHCDAAACLMACPTGAISRSGPRAPVILESAKCVGCRNCALACPYGVPRMSLDGAEVSKCDLCIDRLGRGGIPACVEACPTGTLGWRDDSENERLFAKNALWEAGAFGGTEQ